MVRTLRLRPCGILMLMLAAAACGGSSSPTTPRTPDTTTPPPSGPTPTPGPFAVTGTTVSAIDGSPIGNVSFTVNGALVGLSNAGGIISAGMPASGLNRAVLTSSGFVARETGITGPGAGLTVSLIPSSFDLASFDQMFRHSSVSGQPNALTHWRSAPGLVLERRVVQFTATCAQSYQTVDETISDGDAARILTDLGDGYSMLTANALGALASVATQTTDAAATLTPRQPGRIVVMRAVDLTKNSTFWGYACWSLTGDGEVTGGFILVDRDFDLAINGAHRQFHRSLWMHELGHTLGCQHVSVGRTSVMNSNARTEPNEFDLQSARIAMRRPTGNRTPDIDPTAHSATTLGRGAQTVTWHGAH